ncbi:glycosyltransferase family A protein [Conexibacter sp. JD483]|uniref:glycosyltransferase family 2 protein n=1 Tax=unclassified Conexibacter TaxID=2627773 RepID=UPI0027162B98|nr:MULTISPECIES: glycosyltransferase family A protein [unclassified Conexibacter]MDO8184060.1 glycosyltransferase family A protein [Conexibacter sp. CPCC 205706]MDO8197052.1 glycosyltransferase family A protein [Conexibacter sp. CPCC 205762]MDR9367968.1 glycosyltransferase family A protein [Conexibacter sp. JD483]
MSDRDQPLVSIAVPTYNRAETLARTLDTALGQTHRAIELIVSDQASGDGTEQLCRRLAAADGRLRYLRQPTNAGGSTANFNLLAAELSGAYAMLLADDDWLQPDYVERCLALLQAQPELAVAYGRARYFDGDREVAAGLRHDHLDARPAARVVDYFRRVDDNGVMYGLMRGDALRAALPMPNALGNDWLLMGRVAMHGAIATTDTTHVDRAVGGTSASVDKIVATFGVSRLQARLPQLTIAWQVLADVGWRSPAFAPLGRPARLRAAVAAALGSIRWRALAYHAVAPAIDRAGRLPGLRWTGSALGAARGRWGGAGVLSEPADGRGPGA